MSDPVETRLSARMQLVEEHVRLENQHDLAGVLATFGEHAAYDDEPWNDHRDGIGEVQTYYETLLSAMPDLYIEIVRTHLAAEAIILETIISGTHLGTWRGLPPTGKHIRFSLCGIYTFDQNDRICGERIYYDRIAVLQQLGLSHDPMTNFGRVVTVVTHPLTIMRAVGRKLFSPRVP